jgi:hypothetical protein
MKEKIITALNFPRSLIRGEIDTVDCPHAGNYAGRDPECLACMQGAECEWLNGSDEAVPLALKTQEELEGALEFALGYVDAQVMLWGHNRRNCRCDACKWLRSSQRLFDTLANRVWMFESTDAELVAGFRESAGAAAGKSRQ